MERLSEHIPTLLFETVLDAIGVGVWLLDEEDRVEVANYTARLEMRRAATLTVSDGVIRAAKPCSAKALHRTLSAARAGQRQMVSLGGDGESRMFAAVPLACSGQASAQVLLLCGREPSLEPVSMLLFAKAVGITHSERDVLQCLCDGLVAQDIAEVRSVKLSTVRTQIGSLRGKVGARTVTQMIASVSRLPPVVGRDVHGGLPS